MAELAKGRLRNKREQLTKAMEGRVKAHHRFLLTELLCQIDSWMRPWNTLTSRLNNIAARLKKRLPCWIPFPAWGGDRGTDRLGNWRRHEPLSDGESPGGVGGVGPGNYENAGNGVRGGRAKGTARCAGG